MIHFAAPSIKQREVDSVTRVMESGWLTTGKKNKALAEKINNYIGSKYCVPMSSCTAALHIGLICSGIKEGDEVITTPFTFVSTINTIIYLRAKPVFVDIKENDFIMNEDKIEEKITKKTKAIVVVHYAGFSAHLKRLRDICKRYNLELIEDAAHAFGSKYKKEYIGQNSKYCCYSFYPTKNITTGEGGALVTNDKGVYDRASTLALHGISKDAWKRYTKKGSWQYDVTEIGYKYNLTDIQAAIGLAQLQRIEKLKRQRDVIYKRYVSELRGLNDIEILPGNRYSRPFRHLFVIKLKSDSISREEFIGKMKKKNIVCSVHFIPVYRFTFYKERMHIKKSDFPQSEEAYESCVSLPFSSSMNLTEVNEVIRTIKKIFRHST